jgi:plasmid stabilization system protein ParE
MKRVTFHEEAEAEIVEAARYYETKAPGLGLSFLLDAGDAVDQIGARPEAFQVVTGNVRRKVLRHFPYNVLFAIEPDRIRVLAVGHQKRRPGYWRHRLQ